MILILLFLCVLFLYIGLASSKNDVFSPCVITSTIWMLCIILYLILPHDLPSLSWSFGLTLGCWIFGMCTSSLFIENCKIKKSEYDDPGLFMRDVYLIISVLTLPSLFFYAQDVIEAGVSGNWARDLRLAALGKSTVSKEVYGGIHVIVWQVTFLLELYFFKPRKWYRLLISTVCCLGFCFVTMSKWNLLNVFFMTVCVLYFKKVFSLRHLLIGLGIFLVLCIMLQTVRQKSYGEEDFFVLYLVGSMSAFDTLEPMSSEHFGENTFRIVYAIVQKLGLSSIEPVDPILPWIQKPLQTNTYTGMYPFFKDFGIFGVALFSIVLGLVYGWFYKKAKSLKTFSVLAYSYFVTVMISQYVGDMFVTNLTGHIKFLCVLVFPFVCTKYGVFKIKKRG